MRPSISLALAHVAGLLVWFPFFASALRHVRHTSDFAQTLQVVLGIYSVCAGFVFAAVWWNRPEPLVTWRARGEAFGRGLATPIVWIVPFLLVTAVSDSVTLAALLAGLFCLFFIPWDTVRAAQRKQRATSEARMRPPRGGADAA